MSLYAKLERILSVVLTLAAVVAAGLLFERRFNPPAPQSAGVSRIEYVRDWKQLSPPSAVALGDTARPAHFAVFTDFQCPFCKRMDSALTAFEHSRPGKIVRWVVHYPLPNHGFAMAAAIAFECAAAQGRAREMHAALYAGQAALGVPWKEFAVKANLRDLKAFDACVAAGKDSVPPRISAGVSLARKLGISGTPTVLVNGWLVDPSFPEAIENAIEAVLRGKRPTK